MTQATGQTADAETSVEATDGAGSQSVAGRFCGACASGGNDLQTLNP